MSEELEGFPGVPVVKIPCSQYRGMGLIPGWGIKIPHAAGHSQKIKQNKNKNYSKMSPPTCWNTYYQKEITRKKKKEITRVGEAVEKREPLYTVSGNVNWSRHVGNSLNSSKN